MTLLPRIQMRGYTWSPERGVHPSLTLRGLEPAPQACSPWRALCCQTRAWVPQPQGEALSCPLWEPVWPLSPASPGSPAGCISLSFTSPILQGFPCSSVGKDSACNAGDPDSIPRLGRSPGEGSGNPLQYSCLQNARGQRSLAGYSPWGHKSQTRLSD